MASSFIDIFSQHSWESVKENIYSKTIGDVEKALQNAGKGALEDFAALVSPAASVYLKEMATQSHNLTLKRFGNTMQLYVPMYLSNECQNICTYCGFSFHNKIKRTTLTNAQIIDEAEAVTSMGFNHVLLVTGEATQAVGIDYFLNAVELLKPYFANISMEVQPLEEDEYRLLVEAGVHSVLVYQESYHQENYRLYHTKGKKSNFNYRLDTPDRLGKSGIHKIGLGTLIGLEDWRIEAWFTALHLRYMQKNYWQTKYSVSFPRLRPATGIQEPTHPISDKDFVQLFTAFRLFDEDLELSLSTRESPEFRNQIIPFGFTSMSAGSKTDPGGYATHEAELEQFEIHDKRTPKEMVSVLKNLGYEAVWKDWENKWNANVELTQISS